MIACLKYLKRCHVKQELEVLSGLKGIKSGAAVGGYSEQGLV